MDVPESMREELASVNGGGEEVDLEIWVGLAGRFSLAVGYAAMLWPQFSLVDGYLVREGTTREDITRFGSGSGSTTRSVEAVLNHMHIEHLQYVGCEDCTPDKLRVLGRVLKEMYEAKLAWQFPDRRCIVELHFPDEEHDLSGYQLTFWQAKDDAEIRES